MEITFTNILWTTILVIVLGSLLKRYLKYRNWRVRFSEIPGPPCLPILGNALQIVANRKDAVSRMSERFITHGPIYQLWIGSTPSVSLSRAEDVKVLLSSPKHQEKSYLYKFLKPWLGDSLLLSTGAKWHAHRKLITPAFHFKILEGYFEVFKAKSDILVEKLDKYCQSKEPIDIHSFISFAALDVICETAMGTNINAQNENQSDFIKSLYDIANVVAERTRRLWLFSNFIFSFTENSKIYDKCLEILHSFTKKVIYERKLYRKNIKKEVESINDVEEKKKRIAFLDILLEASENGGNLSETSIREEVDTFMFAGHDTTSSALSWTIFLLGHNLEHQELVFQELDGIFQGENRPITMDDLNEMKYMDRVIKESLRIYPPVPIISRILDEDTQFDKYLIPAGTGINVIIYYLHRDPRYFSNPEKFDPDRFLPEYCTERHPYAYIPFSAGSRNCIGQKFSTIEEKTILASILRKYKIKSVDKREELNLIHELTLKSSEGYRIILERRS